MMKEAIFQEKSNTFQKQNIESLDEILDFSWGFAKTGIIISAFELNLFDQIAEKSLKNDDIAANLNCDTKGVSLLLEALYGMGLLKKNNSGFYVIPASYRPYLITESPLYIGHMWKVHKQLNWDAWSKLTESIKSGKPVTRLFSFEENKIWEIVIPYLNALAKNCAKEIAEFVKDQFPGEDALLLDIGCGSGIYSQYILKENPLMKGIGIDQQNVINLAKKQVNELSLSERLSFIEGDIFEVDYGTSVNNIVLLSNILHGYDNEECLTLVTKAYQSLKPGGFLLINDFIISEQNESILPLLFSLESYLVGRGRTFKLVELQELAKKAGFKSDSYINIPGPFSMLCCVK